jgi:hypothetical protein
MKTQNLASKSGSTFCIPVECESQAIRVQGCEFTLLVSIYAQSASDAEKRVARIDSLQDIKLVSAFVSFYGAEQDRCIALNQNPSAVLQAVVACCTVEGKLQRAERYLISF